MASIRWTDSNSSHLSRCRLSDIRKLIYDVDDGLFISDASFINYYVASHVAVDISRFIRYKLMVSVADYNYVKP